MNFNVWNIKDMLSIPSGSGTTKSSNWTNNQADYSSLSDSQFLFGSQFCPESSETLSAPLDFGVHLRDPKHLQKNSLDSEPSIFTKYQTKPQLFGEDTKDGGLFPLPLSVGKSKGLLEQFEEKKKRAQDKCDSENLYNFISHVRESIHKLQTSVEKSEEHLSSRSQSILDSLETVARTLQETVQAQSNLVLKTVQDKGNMEQAILEMQKRFDARQAEFIEMKSDLKHVEVVVAQQSKNFQQLCEQLRQLCENVPSILAELKSLISVPQGPTHVTDRTSQTSPLLPQSLNFTRQDKYACEEPASGSLRMGSLRPRGEFGVWSEGAKRAALQEEAVLLAVGGSKTNRRVRDKAVQTNCRNQLITKRSLENQDPGVRNLVSLGASQPISRDLNNVVTGIENARQKRQTKDMFSHDPCEQRLVTEQKGRTVELGRKGQQQPRKARRGRPLARKQEHTQGKTSAFSSTGPQSPVSGSQSSTPEQQEPLAQPLHLCGPRSPTKPVCPVLEGVLTPKRTAGPAPGASLQLSGHSSQDNSQLSNSSKGDHQISWFSDLNLESSMTPPCKEPGKNVLYDLGFDSSDDGF
ncbi:interactor of HORMAD1 protein 1 [Artibeus jamaicensis]|uniref:interactor of HORMAD1 protein 1 n=1 Tax=Artibeus jamaicensis TaxID=9417 RepID=UPI00235A7857|nr:interactor of HORMAD1 protein 1 [Artibeus jamaicensis]